VVRLLRQADEFGAPADGDATVAQCIAHQALVVVLTKDENEWIRTDFSPDVAEGHPCDAAPAGPHIHTGRASAELERVLREAEVGIDFEGPGLDPEGSGLNRWPRVPVDDEHSHVSAGKLVGEHQAGGPCPDNEDVGGVVHGLWHRASPPAPA